MAACGAEKCRERLLQYFVPGYVGRQFFALERSFINECEFLSAGKVKKIRQFFEKLNIAGRRVDAAFDLAPVAGCREVGGLDDFEEYETAFIFLRAVVQPAIFPPG